MKSDCFLRYQEGRLAALYHASYDTDADTEEKVAGDHIEHDHRLTEGMDRLVLHERQRGGNVDRIIKPGPYRDPGRGRRIPHWFEPMKTKEQLVQQAEGRERSSDPCRPSGDIGCEIAGGLQSEHGQRMLAPHLRPDESGILLVDILGFRPFQLTAFGERIVRTRIGPYGEMLQTMLVWS